MQSVAIPLRKERIRRLKIMDLNEVKKPKLYSTKEVADFVGVSYITIYRMVKDGRIKAVNVALKGKPIYRFRGEDVQAYYDSLHHTPAGPEILDK